MSILHPEQLPNSNAQFIAYGSPERVADPFGGDDAISIRPQVFVRYYRGVKIKELRTPNPDTVNLVLDPESVGLAKEFGAYMNADDPVVPYLREQFEAGNPIDVGLEYQRRKKTKNTKANISPLVPIHALRGANDATGSGDNSTMLGAAGNNISSKVALINGRRTTVIESDPREWQILTSNRQGDLPPEGWKAVIDREDWTRVGAISPKGDALPPSGQTNTAHSSGTGDAMQGLDMNALSKMIGHEVRKGLKDYGEYLMRQDQATHGVPTSQPPSSAVEGKPWNTWVNKEHLNLGSYLVSGEGHALRWAYRYLATIGDDDIIKADDLRWVAAQELADASQHIADRVQAAAYNGEVRADRTSASFKEAVIWVRFHIEETYPFETAETFDFEQWFDKVGRAATGSLKQAETNAHTFLAERNPKAAQATQATPQSDTSSTGETPALDNTALTDSFLQVLTQSWTDRDAILNLAREAKAKGILDATVWANPHDGQFATKPFDGAQEITIAYLTQNQYSLLNQAAQAAQTESATTEAAPAETTAPAAQEQTTQTDDAPQQAPQPEQASAPQQQPQRTEQHIAADLSRVTTEEEIAAIYTEARDLNLLMAEIWVQKNTGPLGVTPVPPNTDGAETLTLGAVFDALRAELDNQSTPTPEPTEATPEPETAEPTAPAQQPDTAQEEPAQESPEPPAQQSNPTPSEGNDQSLEQDIAERALTATTAEEINNLYNEAEKAGVKSATVALRGGSGPLESFLKSRLKRVRARG